MEYLIAIIILLGLDFFVLDQRGCLMGIPRKTRIESR